MITMKAARLHRRGGPEGLVYEDVPRPTPGPGDALVRVRATGITPSELFWESTWTTRDGHDRLPIIPAHEVSGVVAAIAPGVTDLQVGDPVYGLTDFWRDGAAAEYVLVQATDLAPMPSSVDDIQAAALPLSALTAWQALFEHAHLARHQHILIHGAAGGVGVFAVQLARWSGVRVTATASVRNAALLRDLGADEVIDYATTRFEDVVRDVDVVLDTVGGETQNRSWQTLQPGGILVSLLGPVSPPMPETGSSRGISFVVEPNRAELIEIARLVDAGIVRPVVETAVPLAQARDAYLGGRVGHRHGKIVLYV